MSFEVESLCGSIDKMIQKHLPPEEVRRRDEQADPPNHLLKPFLDEDTKNATGGLAFMQFLNGNAD